MGARRGWCTDEQRRRWVSQTVRTLLKDDRFHQRDALLNTVRRRYADGDNSESFDRAMGDGQLWLALLVACDLLPDATARERLQQVTLFRDFISRRELLGSADQTRLIGLYGAHSAPDVIEAARSRAMRLGRALRDLECSLRQSYEDLLRGQSSVNMGHQAGELVWSPNGGWGITTKDQHDQHVDVYVAKGDVERTFKTRWHSHPHGWFLNVSMLTRISGIPPDLVEQADSFLQALTNVSKGRMREGITH